MVALYSMQSLWLCAFCLYILFQVSSPLNTRSWIWLFQSIAQHFFFFETIFVVLPEGFESFYCKVCFVHVYISTLAFWQDGLTWSSPLVQCGIHGLPCDAKLTGPEAKVTLNQKSFHQHTLQLLWGSFYQSSQSNFWFSHVWPNSSTFVSSV